mgnify:FL=1
MKTATTKSKPSKTFCAMALARIVEMESEREWLQIQLVRARELEVAIEYRIYSLGRQVQAEKRSCR